MGIMDFLNNPSLGTRLMAIGEGLSAIDAGRPGNFGPYAQLLEQQAGQRRMQNIAGNIRRGGILNRIGERQGWSPETMALMNNMLEANPGAMLPHLLESTMPRAADPWAGYKVAGGNVIGMGPEGPYVALSGPEKDPLAKERAILALSPEERATLGVGGTKPLTGVAKLEADRRAGLVDDDTYRAAKAKLLSGQSFEVTTPDGTTVRYGPSATGAEGNLPLGRKPANAVTEDVLSGEVMMSNIKRLGELAGVDPETGKLTDEGRSMFTYQGRLRSMWANLRDKAGVDLAPDEKAFLSRRSAMVQASEQLFNAYRKEITGAAAAMQELERLQKSFVNEKMGPTEFEANFNEYMKTLERLRATRIKLLQAGIDPSRPENADEFDRVFKGGSVRSANGSAGASGRRSIRDLSDDELRRLYGGN